MHHVVGLIRVITLTDENLLNAHGRLIERAFPELRIISRCIEDQPLGIYDSKSEESAKPKILRLALELEKQGVETIIISCVADPAVAEARQKLRIPVIGAGSAAASIALSLGRRIGVLNLNEKTPKQIKRILGNHLVVEARPRNVRNTLDLLTDWGRESAKESLKILMNKGVDVIILGCTGYSTIGFAEIVEEITKVHVVDPVISSGAVALAVFRQKKIFQQKLKLE